MDANLIVKIINNSVGDPMHAINTAKHDYPSVELWILSQSGQSAAFGATSVFIPGAHIPLLLADFGILIHKMAYVCQGIAGLRECPITKESSEFDLALILALWTKAIDENELEQMLIQGIESTNAGIPDKRKISPKNALLECPLQTTSEIILVDKAGTKLLASVGGMLLNRLSRTLFLRMATRESAKFALGFLPFIGGAIAGAINYNIVEQVARCADIYYLRKKEMLVKKAGD